MSRRKTTNRVELVETHNIALSLRRIMDMPGYDPKNWRRALYHAIAMSFVSDGTELEKIRQAMGLP